MLDEKQLTDDLRDAFRGRLHFDRLTRGLYSTDASPFQVEPLAVAVPEDADSVAALVAYCHTHNVAVIPRGAGTGLAGESLGPAVVMDLSVRFRRILDVGSDTVTVEAGAVLADVNAELAKVGRRFAPDPASAATCTVGGMIATNASGANAFHHGYTRDHVSGLAVVWDSGERDWVGDTRPTPPGPPSVRPACRASPAAAVSAARGVKGRGENSLGDSIAASVRGGSDSPLPFREGGAGGVGLTDGDAESCPASPSSFLIA